MLPPVLVREEAMYGTGFFPTDESNIYALEATTSTSPAPSEVALAGLTWTRSSSELPLRYAAFSTCFRREAGAAGKDTRGMFRVHQFNKVEMFVYCDAGALGGRARAAARDRGEARPGARPPLPRRQRRRRRPRRPAAKKYDIEAWFPCQQRYREITSTSNTTDFQARRLGIRYRARRRASSTPHTLNGTAVTDRTLLAILENFQDDGGSVSIPEPLWEFGAPRTLGGDRVAG